MTDDFEVIWEEGQDGERDRPPMMAGDRITSLVSDATGFLHSHPVKLERKRQLPTKFGSVIKTAGNGTVLVLVAGLSSGVPHWCREDGTMYRASTMKLSPGWTLVRDGVD